MDHEDLISVIVPVYNTEHYLEKCINSIINQTYSNIEIILVDDGSTDSCPAICDQFAENNHRVKVIHKKNGGLSEARNFGIKASTGKYIAFVDSDDYIANDMIEQLNRAMKSQNADLAICNFMKVDENGVIQGTNSNQAIGDGVVTSESIINDKMLDEVTGWHWVVTWNKLYKAEIFNNLCFPRGKEHEDEYIIHEILLQCMTIACIAQPLYYYVQRSGSIMSAKTNIKSLDYVEAVFQRAIFLSEYPQYQKAAAQYVQFGIKRYQLYVNTYKRNDLAHMKRYKELHADFRKCVRKLGLIENRKITKKIYYTSYYVAFYHSAILMRKLKPLYAYYVNLKLARNLKGVEDDIKQVNCILIDTPIHGNLGDQAIALAEEKFFEKANVRYYEITADEFDRYENVYKKAVKGNKTIYVPGGGFLGDIWPVEEYRFRKILQLFSKQKIIVFPQTVSFTMDTKEGREFFEESRKIYSAHKNLTVFVREEKSYIFMKRYMPEVHVELVPDMVLSYQFKEKPVQRSGILLCLRNDREKSLSSEFITQLYHELQKKYEGEKVAFTDTVVEKIINQATRKEEVENKLREFSSAKLIITDRLHGMIFAVITGTPCIAMGNSNGKVEGVYQWIRNIPYLYFVKSLEEYENVLDSLEISEKYTFQYDFSEEKYQILNDMVKKLTK